MSSLERSDLSCADQISPTSNASTVPANSFTRSAWLPPDQPSSLLIPPLGIPLVSLSLPTTDEFSSPSRPRTPRGPSPQSLTPMGASLLSAGREPSFDPPTASPG